MGLDPSILHSEHIARLLSPEERAKAGVQTAAEAQAKFQRVAEKKMHEEFEGWLRHHLSEAYYDHSRMDRATSNRVGHPDFMLQRAGQVLNIEFKAQGGKLSAAQQEVHRWIASTGGKVHVCYSAADAINIARLFFTLTDALATTRDGTLEQL